MLLQGKIALITGGSRGIGRATAILLAEHGADIIINYAGNKQAADEVCEAVKKLGRKVLAIQASVSKSDEVQKMIDDAVKEFGRIDILVNNAGITKDGLLMRMKDEDWSSVIDTNLTGVYNCSKAVTKPMMKQKAGSIVNMSSVVGVNGNVGQSNYAASKAGIIGFSKALAKELASRNIRVNAIAPGFIATDMTTDLSDKVKEEMLKNIPLNSLGTAEDVAQAVLFLASDASKYITGQTLHVDGGMVM